MPGGRLTERRAVRAPEAGSRRASAPIFHDARTLYEALHLDRARIRLVGVRMEGLRQVEEVETQLVLGAPERGWREAEEAVDRLSERFGKGSVLPARLLPERLVEAVVDTPTRRPDATP